MRPFLYLLTFVCALSAACTLACAGESHRTSRPDPDRYWAASKAREERKNLDLPGQLYIAVHQGLLRPEYKEGLQQDYGSYRTTYPSVGLGLQMGPVGIGIGLYAFAPPSVDLVAGMEASVHLYPLRLLAKRSVQPFAVLSLGSAGGEDIEGGGLLGYGAGMEWRLGSRLAAQALVRRLRFSYYEDVALKSTLTHIGIGLKLRLL